MKLKKKRMMQWFVTYWIGMAVISYDLNPLASCQGLNVYYAFDLNGSGHLDRS